MRRKDKKLLALAAVGMMMVSSFQNCANSDYKVDTKAVETVMDTGVVDPNPETPNNPTPENPGGGGPCTNCGGGGETTPNTAYIEKTVSTEVASKVDILVIVDNSGSMKAEMEKIQKRFNNLISKLSDLNWRIAVTTTDVDDDGEKGSFITKDDDNSYCKGRSYIDKPQNASEAVLAEECFKNRVFLETNGSTDESGIYALNMHLDQGYAHEWMRDDAHLAVVVLSDEDERSNSDNYYRYNILVPDRSKCYKEGEDIPTRIDSERRGYYGGWLYVHALQSSTAVVNGVEERVTYVGSKKFSVCQLVPKKDSSGKPVLDSKGNPVYTKIYPEIEYANDENDNFQATPDSTHTWRRIIKKYDANLRAKDKPESILSTLKSSFPNLNKTLSFHSIVVDNLQCLMNEGEHFGGAYIKASQMLNGFVSNICNPDYATPLAQTSSLIKMNISAVKLECSPVVNDEYGIALYLNGVINKTLKFKVQGDDKNGYQAFFLDEVAPGTQIDLKYFCAEQLSN